MSVSLIDQHITLEVSLTLCSPKLFIRSVSYKKSVYVLGGWPKMGRCVCMRTSACVCVVCGVCVCVCVCVGGGG